MHVYAKDQPLIKTIPSPQEVRERLAAALREVALCRKLLNLAKEAESYRAPPKNLENQP